MKNVIIYPMAFYKEKRYFFVVLRGFLLFLLFAFSFLYSSKSVYATALTWTGLAGDSNYSTAGNWSPSKVPSSADTITFDNTCTNCNATIDVSTTTTSITLTSTYTGTVSLANGVNFNSSGGFTMDGGTFSAGSATLTLGSNCSFTKTGGIFNEDTSTVVFSPGWPVTNTFNIDGVVAGSETFYNVNFNGQDNNSHITISSGDTMIVTGTLTLTNGTVDTGNIDARGNIIQASTFDGSSANLDLNNDGVAQTYTLNGGTGPSLRLDSPADALDSIILNSTSTLYSLNITSGFGANTVNTTYNGYGLILTYGYTQAAGTFNAPNTLTLGGNSAFTKTGGTFNEGVGTVVFAPGWLVNGTISIDGASAGSETFYNVMIQGDVNSDVTVSSGDTMVVGGTLTLSRGRINGSINVNGNIIQTSTAGGGSATIDFSNDSVSQTYTLNGGVGPKLRLDSGADASDSIVLNATSTLYSLTIDSGFGANTINTTYNGYGLTLSNDYTQAAGTFNAPNTLTLNGNFTKTGGTFNEGTGTVVFAPGWNVTNTLNIDGASAGSETFYNVNISATDNGAHIIISSGDTMTVTGTLTLTNGAFDTGTLNVTGNISISSAFDGGTSPLVFSGSSDQTFNLTGATSLFNSDITVNKSAGKVSLLSALVMDASSQDLIIQSGTLDLNGNALTVNGTSGTLVVQNGGTLKLNGDETITANTGNPQIQTGGTVEYAGAGSYTLKGYSYSNLSITGSGSFTATSGPLTIGKNFLQSAGTFTASSATTTVGGNFTRTAGTFTHNSGTVNLNGTNQSIGGSTIFNNLYKTITSSDTLSFGAGATTTVAGTLTFSGALNNLLSLISSSTGSYFYIDPQSTRYVDYLSVKDSYNSNATAISSTGHNITDAGNNVNWGFNQNPSAPSSLSPASGSWTSDTTPTLTFSLSDPDAGDTVRYRIQIDDTSNSFSSLVTDYISGFGAQGSRTFTVGQSAGSGSYVVGSASQTLSDSATYFWRVLTADNNNASSTYTTANSGSVAFKVDSTAPTAGDVSLSATSTTSFIVTISGASDATSGLSTTPYIFYNTTNSTNSSATSSTSWLSDGLSPDTEYSFEVSVIDLAGNTSTTTSYTGRTSANPVVSNNSVPGNGSPVMTSMIQFGKPMFIVPGSHSQTTQTNPGGVTQPVQASFNRNLYLGLNGDDVKKLQDFLVSQNAGPLAQKLKANGTTRYFGPLTQSALIEFQKANDISPAVGYFGPKTMEMVNVPVVPGNGLIMEGKVIEKSVFTRDLYLGLNGDDVKKLQDFLVSQNKGPLAQKLKANGTTRYFGPLTQSALIEFQKANDISPAVGYFGPKTMEYVKSKGNI